MEIKDLVKSRRTIHQFKPEPVPDDAMIRAAIEQAIWAAEPLPDATLAVLFAGGKKQKSDMFAERGTCP